MQAEIVEDDMDSFSRTDIVIIGGGFGGMNAAMALDLRLRRGLKIDVTLISRSNCFLFTPLLAEVAASLVERSEERRVGKECCR